MTGTNSEVTLPMLLIPPRMTRAVKVVTIMPVTQAGTEKVELMTPDTEFD